MSTVKYNFQSNSNNLRFVKDIIQLKKVNDKTGEIIIDYRVVIKLKNLQNGRARIHRYTDFLNNWRNCKTKTALDVAGYVVPFINYITFQLTEKELASVQDLTFEYAAEYLSKYAENKSRITVMNCDRILSQLYYFLAKNNLLNNINKDNFTFTETQNGKLRLQSPFAGRYSSRSNKKIEILHHIDDELIFEFLYTALQVVPQIALGVYFQIFGGLRIGEIVNIRYIDISVKEPYGRNGMVIILKQSHQRTDLKRDAITSVKKPRNQPVIAIGDILSLLYMNHIKKYKNQSISAVFIDNNGNPMSKDTYYRNFKKLKEAFINKLKASDSLYLKLYSSFLNSQKWATHIGRGTFSNIIADVAENATEIAIWRGDSNLDSALSYISDSRKLEKKLIKNMNNFYTGKIREKFANVLTSMGRE